MKISYSNFKKIKGKKDLYNNNKLKYPINEPIIGSNYLFHNLINLGNIKLLDKENYPIYKFNNNNYDGFMIASNNQDYDTLKYLLLKFPEYIYNTNSDNYNWFHLLDINDNLYNFIIDKDLEFIEWNKLLYLEDGDKHYTMEALLSFLEFKQIKNLLKFLQLENISNSQLINLFNNPKLNTENIIYLLKYLIENKVNFNNMNYNKGNCIYPLLIKYDYEILDILYQYKKEYNQGIYGYTPLTKGDHSLLFLLQDFTDNNMISLKAIKNRSDFYTKNNNNLKFIFDFYDKFKEYLNINEYNNIGSTLIMSIFEFKDYLKNDLDDKFKDRLLKIEKELIENADLNHSNIYGYSLMHTLVLEDIKYSKYIKSEFNPNIRNVDGYTVNDLANNKWKEFIKDSKYNININNNQLNLIKTDKTYFGKFKAFFLDIGLQLYNLTQIYPNFTVPKLPLNLLNSYSFENNSYPDQFIINNQDFAWSIIWNDKNSYYIHPNLNLVINRLINENKYRYVGLLLSYRTFFGGLHAMPILYDLKNKTIERWDSFGNNSIIENLDEILEEKLTWNTGLTYLGVAKLSNIYGIQDKSNETDNNNTKTGDFGGYCAAWTIWYMEHRILNPDLSTKDLVDKTIKKITQTWCNNNNRNHKIVDFIRDYASTIQERTQNLFKKNNWSYNEYTNNVYPIELENQVIHFIQNNI
ncbi:hypothetical protein [Chlorella virus XW01]|nr:hypothetical protein [Chlorella virus XW01]